MRDRVKKGDYVIELRGREGTYRLHAQKGVVAEPVMERIADHIARLGAWAVRVGDENWPLPAPTDDPRSPAVDDETVALLERAAMAVERDAKKCCPNTSEAMCSACASEHADAKRLRALAARRSPESSPEANNA